MIANPSEGLVGSVQRSWGGRGHQSHRLGECYNEFRRDSGASGMLKPTKLIVSCPE